MLNVASIVSDFVLIERSRKPKSGAKALPGELFYCYQEAQPLEQFYLLCAIVQLRRSSKASTNSTSDIFNADATARIVSNVGDLVPFSHLDQVGASTPVISAKTEYESFENFPLAPVDELDNTTIQLSYNGLTPKSIVAGLQTQRCLLLDRKAPRLRLCFGCPQIQLTEKASLRYWKYLGTASLYLSKVNETFMNVPQMAPLWIASAAALNFPSSRGWRHDQPFIELSAAVNCTF